MPASSFPPDPRRRQRPAGDQQSRSAGSGAVRRDRTGRPTEARDAGRGQASARPRRDSAAAGRPERSRRDAGADPRHGDRARRDRPQAPDLPPDADPALLDRGARAGLRSLPETLADRVAAHLVAAGQLLDDDPAAADAHAKYARQLAPRLAVVREAVALTAYRTGDYATALGELRALRRMTGDPTYLPVMADCERGLGRPERAIALARDAAAAALDPASKVELAIVVSGARRDRGEHQAAVAALRPFMQSKAVRPWTPRLWYAYADALLDAGQVDDAREWFAATAGIDEDGDTDADERLAAVGDGPHRGS